MPFDLQLPSLRMLTHNLIQPLPLHTPIKSKALGRLIQLLHREILKQTCKLHRKSLRHEILHDCSCKVALRVPGCGICVRGLGTHFVDEFCKGANDGGDFGTGVLAPAVELQATFLLKKGLDGFVPQRIRVGVDHALDADVFVQPDAPRNLVLVVDLQLGSEEVVPLLINLSSVGIHAWV